MTIVLLAGAVAGAGLTGCSTESSRRKKLLERIQPPQPVLAATTVYGGGLLKVESWLGPSVRLKRADEAAEGEEGRGHRKSRPPEVNFQSIQDRTDHAFLLEKQGGQQV